jgi:nucleoside-diphosphate-sugar epimerase
MNAIVTGAAGFLGYHVCKGLRDYSPDCDILGLDIHHPKDAWRIGDLDIDYKWMHLEDFTPDLGQGAQYVVHCAASSNVGFVQESPKYAMHQTLLGTLRLLECLVNVPIYRFINISTHSVYGTPAYNPVDEIHGRNPTNVYGALKVAQEALVGSYAAYYDIPVVTLRAATMFGERDRRGSTVYELTLKAMKNEPFQITGDGKQSRDFNYVGNMVDAILLALTADLKCGAVMNVGSGNALTIVDLIQKIIEATDSKSEIEFVPARPGDTGPFSLDIMWAKQCLKYTPHVDFEEGLGRLISWIMRFLQ